MINKFHRAITEQLHTLFLQPHFDSPFHFFIQRMPMSMKVFFHFWKDMKIAWWQVWTVWRLWQNGEIQPLNSSHSGMRSVWPSSAILQQNTLLVPSNLCQLLFQRFECCEVSPSTDRCPSFKEIHVDNTTYIPKNCCHKFPHQSLCSVVLYKGVSLRRGYSIDWHMASGS